MATWSCFFTDTTDPGPQVGDGRPYTAGEWRTLYKYLWAQGNADRGVLKGVLNACAVTVLGANSLQVNTGLVMCAGGIVVMEAAETLAPASAPGGQVRQDSVIVELDLDGTGVGQNKVRATYKQGTAGAPPAMTQNANIWQIRLYNYTISDAGAITGLSDQRQYLRTAVEGDHGDLSGLADDDHTNYYNAARHTKAVHDALNIDSDTVDGYHAADLISGVALGFVGVTVLWGGALGGSDGHRPVSGGAHEDWHWANGELVSGVQTLDSRGKVVMGSDGAAGTYPVNATGGAATINIAHTHAVGTLANANESAHTHAAGSIVGPTHRHEYGDLYTGASVGATNNVAAGANSMPGLLHSHNLVAGHTGWDGAQACTGTSAAGSAHTHSLSGATLTNLSAAQSVMNPYRSWYLITYLG